MTVTLSDNAQQMVSQLLATGSFSSVDEAVETAIRALTPITLNAFDPGEVDRLIAEGETSIAKDGVVGAAQVFAEMREQASRHRKQSNVE